jgi:hypothetical protein
VAALHEPATHHRGLHRFFQGATWPWAAIMPSVASPAEEAMDPPHTAGDPANLVTVSCGRVGYQGL